MTSNLIGRRAVFTQITREWDKAKADLVETGRTLFRGEIVGFYAHGQYNYPYVVMLYDSGALCTHSIDHITIEALPTEGAYR